MSKQHESVCGTRRVVVKRPKSETRGLYTLHKFVK